MPATQASAEEAVVAAALSRGFVTPAQVERARRDVEEFARRGQKVELLAVVSARHLAPPQRDELRKVYQDALAQSRPPSAPAPAPGDEESTQLLDRPVLPPGASPPAGGDAGATLAGPPGVAQAFGASPGPAGKVTQADAAGPAPSSADAVGLDRTVAQGPPTGDLATPPRADGKGKGPPRRIGNYDIVRELGRGGMGVVYDARHVTLDRRVALKVLLAGTEATGEDVQRFQVEAKAAARLDHPNVVRVHEQGQDADGHWFMAMDLVDGESLVARLEREGALDPREAAAVVRDVARAVAYAHSQSVLHRDLKPHNVLIDRSGTPKLTDFGLAKLVGDQRGKSITRTGSGILGSPAYMSPEQAGDDAKRVDVRCDVYGLGATMYHAITGKMPFDGDTLARVVVAVLQKPPVAPSKVNRKVPKDLETICLKCLEKDPKHRYQSAADLVADLDRFLEDQAISARRPSPLERGSRYAARNPRVVLAGAVLTLALVAAGVYVRGALATSEASAQASAATSVEEKARATKAEADREAAERERALAATQAEEERRKAAEERAALAQKAAEERAALAQKADEERAALQQKADEDKAALQRKADEEKAALAQRAAEEKAANDARLAEAQAAADRASREVEQARQAEERRREEKERKKAEEARRRREEEERRSGHEPQATPRTTVVPEWVERRQRLLAEHPGELQLTSRPKEAFEEAAERRCPVVLVLLRQDVKELPPELRAASAALDQRVVLLYAQDATAGGGAHVLPHCSVQRLVSCDDHEAAWDFVKDEQKWPKNRQPKVSGAKKEEWVITVRRPDRTPFATCASPRRDVEDEDGRRFEPDQLLQTVEAAQRELGAAPPLADLLEAAAELQRVEEHWPTLNLEEAAAKDGPARRALQECVKVLTTRGGAGAAPAVWAQALLDRCVAQLQEFVRTHGVNRTKLQLMLKSQELAERVLPRR